MSYSRDLREKVIDFVEAGIKKGEVSRLFKISRPTIDGWIKLKRAKGSLEKKELVRAWRKISAEALQQHVSLYPDCELSERAKQFKVSITGIWLALKRLKITRKKRPLSIKNAMSKDGKYF